MKKIRSHFVARWFCLLFAVQIFNGLIDGPDLEPDFQPENLAYNKMESAFELIIEKVLKFENAIPENDESDDSDFQDLIKKQVLWSPRQLEICCIDGGNYIFFTSGSNCYSEHLFFETLFSKDLSPPPKMEVV